MRSLLLHITVVDSGVVPTRSTLDDLTKLILHGLVTVVLGAHTLRHDTRPKTKLVICSKKNKTKTKVKIHRGTERQIQEREQDA